MSSSTSDSESNLSSRTHVGLVLAGMSLWVLLLIGVTEPLATDGIRRLSPFRYQILTAELDAAAVQALAIGDSQAGLGFRSQDRHARSVAFPGETVLEMALKIQYLVPKLPAVSVVAIQFQPHLFFLHRDAPPKPPYLELVKGHGVFHPFEGMLRQFDPCCRSAMPKLVARHLLGLPLAEPEPDVGENGYLLYGPHKVAPGTRTEQAVREIASYGSTEPVPSLRVAYEQLLDRLQARGVAVVLVRYPLSPEYLAIVPPTVLAEADRYGTALVRARHVSMCGAWDAIANPAQFFNADHLNQDGARAYWPTIAQCLARYMPGMEADATASSLPAG